MSEWSQMTELDNLSKSGVTPNLVTLNVWPMQDFIFQEKLLIAAIY